MSIIPQVDFSKDTDLKGTAKQVAAVGAGAIAVALLPAEAAVATVAVVTVGTGIVVAKTVGWLWDKVFD